MGNRFFRYACDAPAEVSQHWYQSQGSEEEERPTTARPRPRSPTKRWPIAAKASPQGRPASLAGVAARRGDNRPWANPLAARPQRGPAAGSPQGATAHDQPY
ncbi:hypothetical protein B296_00059071, partial [Ensete ventricosum]